MPRKPYFRAFDGWWYAQLNQGTKRKQVKLVKGKDQEQEAYKAFCRLMADEGGVVPAGTAQIAAVVCDFFLDHAKRHFEADTVEHYERYLQSFCDRCGRIHVAELKPFHITKWLDANEGWKASRRHATIVVKRAFKWATDQGLIGKDPFVTVRAGKANSRDRDLTAEERVQILDTIRDKQFKEFVFAMQETGCRPGEVARVSAADVNLDLGVWILKRHKTEKKTGKPRVIYLTPAMLDLTKRLIAEYPEGPLFRGPRGHRPFSRNNIRCRFRRLRAKLKHLAHFVCYNFRSAFTTDALEHGVGVAQVAELLGHTSTDMVMRHYSRLSKRVQHMRDMAQKATAT